MNISVQTNAHGGHIIVYIINSNGIRILTVTDNDQGSCTLVPGFTYRFEFHVWGAQSANYQIQAIVTPVNNGFQPFNWERSYDGAHQDMGGFYFNL